MRFVAYVGSYPWVGSVCSLFMSKVVPRSVQIFEHKAHTIVVAAFSDIPISDFME